MRIRRFFTERRGAVMPLFAVVLPLAASAAAVSVDLTQKLETRSALQRTADAAALAGARSMSSDLLSERNMRRGANRRAEDLSETLFLSQLEELTGDVNGQAQIDVKEDREAQEIVANLTYIGHVNTILPDLGSGWSRLEIKTEVRVPLRQRVEVHFLIDRSPSMGVGADPQDQRLMERRLGCAFACHRSNRTPEAAADIGANLRFDVVNDAVKAAMEKFEAIPKNNLDIVFGIHTFSNTTRTELENTGDFDEVATTLRGLRMASEEGEGGTNFENAFKEFADKIKENDRIGGGIAPKHRFVVLLTDGVATNVTWTHPTQHQWRPDPAFRTFEPALKWWHPTTGRYPFTQGMDPSTCGPITRLENTDLFVFELRYTAASQHGTGKYVRKYIKPRIKRNLRSCVVKESDIYSANNTNQIKKSLDKIMQEITSRLGLRIVK